MSHLVPDPGCCPLCGEANNCSLTTNCAAEPGTSKENQFSCWCMAYQLNDNARNALNQKLSTKQSFQQKSSEQNLPLQYLPQEHVQPKACLCQRCLADIARQL